MVSPDARTQSGRATPLAARAAASTKSPTGETGLAGRRTGQHHDGVPSGLRRAPRARHRSQPVANHHEGGCVEPRIPGLDGFLLVSPLAALQVGANGGRQHDLEPRDDVERVGEGGCIGHGRAGSDHGRVVGHRSVHVRQRQGDGPSGRRGRELAPLDPREVLPHAVQFVDRGAGIHQPLRRLDFVGERDPFDWRGEHRGGAAREQQEQTAAAGALSRQRQRLFGRRDAAGIGRGMPGFEAGDPDSF